MIKFVSVVICLACFAASALAQETLPSPGITPDSWLYGLDRALEAIQKALVFTPEAKAKLSLQLATERLAEAREMIEKGEVELAKKVAKDYKEELTHAVTYGAEIKDLAKKKEFDEMVALATTTHIEVLEDVLEKVPDEAKSAIELAMEVSRKGQEECLSRLSNTEPEKALKLYFMIAEKRLEKIKKEAKEENVEEIKKIAEDYKSKINKSINIMINETENKSAIFEIVANATSKHLEVLEELLGEVPDEAKNAIEKAMNVSIKGQQEALEALEKVKPEKAKEIRKQVLEKVGILIKKLK